MGGVIKYKEVDFSYEKVMECINLFDKSEARKEEVLRELFSDKSNTDVRKVLIKVTVLDSFYSTQLNKRISLVAMADRIVAINELDKMLQSGSFDAFRQIEGADSTEYKAETSFASKYCNWSNPEAYPIYDENAKRMLIHILKLKGRSEKYPYDQFCNDFITLKEKLSKEHNYPYTIKELDKYLWYYAKHFLDCDAKANS